MPTVMEFRQALTEQTIEDIIDSFFYTEIAAALSKSDTQYIQTAIASGYGQPKESVDVIITGSAKLGFSTMEKYKNGELIGERYRPFSSDSDIDVAVISPAIFDMLWIELSSFSHKRRPFPWEAERLGDYLVCGWLRPDRFPKGQRLYRCDSWFDIFRRLSANTRFDRHRVTGGLFSSKQHLSQYISRSVQECMDQENMI